MKEYLILNDTHLAFGRKGGTTHESAQMLQKFLFDELSRLLTENNDKDIIHGGDLFDKFEASNAHVLQAFQIFSDFITATDRKVYLFRANHDWHPSGDKLSAWELFATVLEAAHPHNVKLIYGKLTHIHDLIYGIGHCHNQQVFDEELNEALQIATHNKDPKTLMLHANYDNKFAEQSDQSLNVSEEMARKLVDAGYRLVFFHEHQSRSVKFSDVTSIRNFNTEDDVLILGNQTPSSISDCLSHGLAQRDGTKYAHVIDSQGKVKRIQTWTNEGNFIRVQWDELAKVKNERFVRVEGSVAQAQVDDVFTKIQKFRSKSNAFIVTNAVKVEGIESLDEEALEVSLDDIKGFDIKGEFFKLFSAKEQEVLSKVMEATC